MGKKNGDTVYTMRLGYVKIMYWNKDKVSSQYEAS